MYAVSAPPAPSTVQAERRRGSRYPITVMAQLRRIGSERRGRAVIHNISSHGAFFSTEIDVDEGEQV